MNINAPLPEGHQRRLGVGVLPAVLVVVLALGRSEAFESWNTDFANSRPAVSSCRGNTCTTCWGGNGFAGKQEGVGVENRLPAAVRRAEAVVKIEHAYRNEPDGATIVSRGAGVRIALGGNEKGSGVLTVAHLFREGVGTVTVKGNAVHARTAELLAVDRTWDLALLRVPPSAATPVNLADRWPRPGEDVYYRGFPFGVPGDWRRGRSIGYVRIHIEGTVETMLIRGEVRQGDSGGPILNAQGELVGIVWGTDGQAVYATYGGRIRRFLETSGFLPSAEDPPRKAGPPPPLPKVPPWRPSENVPRQEKENSPRPEREKSVGHGRASSGDTLPDRLGDTAFRSLWLQGLAMFGISGPSALIIAWGLRRLWLRWRRRRNEKTDPGRSEKGEVAKRPLDDGYARQLAEVYALSGRSPIADATLGRVYDEELKQATTSSDGAIAAFARSVRDRVAEKFYRIHDRNPLPAEPIEQH